MVNMRMKEQQARNKASAASASAAANGGRDSKKVTVSEFQKNVQSKAELIYILGVKGKRDISSSHFHYLGQYFLPDKRYCSLDYLRAVLSGAISVYRNEQVRPVNIPRFKTLTLKIVYDYAMSHPICKNYLPEMESEGEPQLDRNFVFTVVNTADKTFFPSQLHKIEERKIELKKQAEEDVILIKPEMLSLLESFKRDAAPSTRKNYRSLALLKMHAKKRNRTMFEADMAEAGVKVVGPVAAEKKFKPEQRRLS